MQSWMETFLQANSRSGGWLVVGVGVAVVLHVVWLGVIAVRVRRAAKVQNRQVQKVRGRRRRVAAGDRIEQLLE